jgi:hypothetical protein
MPSPVPGQPPVVLLTKADDGKVVNVVVGQEILVLLKYPEPRAGAFIFVGGTGSGITPGRCAEYLPDVDEATLRRLLPKGLPRGTGVYRFRATEPGADDLSVRAWERASNRVNDFAVRLVVRAAGQVPAPQGGKPQAAPKDAFAISYGHAGLTSLTVEKGKLHYSWATHRKPRSGKPGPELQSMESYDLHKATIWLTEAEEKKFREWVTRHKVFDFKGEYKSASGGRSYGAAFQSGLTVTAGGRKHGIAWVGDSKTPETLNAAVGELLSLAAAVEKDRRQ